MLKAIADRLRDSLQLQSQPQQRNLEYGEAIAALNCPVSVHIQIGDYALHTSTEFNQSQAGHLGSCAR